MAVQWLLMSCSLYAQSKKVPVYELTTDKTVNPDPHAAKGLITGFTQIVLRPGYSGIMDTAEVYKVKFYPTGYLQLIESYEYMGARRFENDEDDAIFKNRSRINNGDRTTYEYDKHGNITSRKTYNLAAENSSDASLVLFLERYNDEKMKVMEKYIEDEELSAEDQEAIDSVVHEKMQLVMDSISNAGAKEVAHLERDENYIYDKNNNPIYSYDPLSKNNHRYFYTYHPDGFVKIQRSHYHSRANGYLYYSTTENHFTYDDKGRITSVKTYIAENDSGEIATEKNLRSAENTWYNKKGLPEKITYQLAGGTITHVFTYQDTLQKTLTVLKEGDTVSHTMYMYDGGLVKEVRQVGYQSGRKIGSERRVISYNKDGLPIEELVYMSTKGSNHEKLEQQDLFFYGLRSDRQTAQRKLTRIEPRKEEVPQKNIEPATQVPVTSQPKQQIVAAPQSTVFTYVEQMPEFIGDVNKYITDNLQYPSAPQKKGVANRVLVRFIVGSDGTVRSPEIVRSVREDLDKEALRVVEGMPKWRPGKQNGRAVDVYYTLPILFK